MKNAMASQVVEMRKGGGFTFWPKPILHPTCPPTFKNSIVINVRLWILQLRVPLLGHRCDIM
jgi:antibiotic biosynthesis monooxygenase (ABM) superfamily enzyme